MALVSLAGVIWGTVGPAVQITVMHSDLSPLTISAYRAIASVALLALILLARARLGTSFAVGRPHARRLGLVGLLTGASQLLFFVSVDAAGVSLATVICMGFAPPMLLVVTCTRERRLPRRNEVITVFTAVLGLLLISLVGGGREHASSPTLGILAALGAGTAFALAADLLAPLANKVDPITTTAATMGFAALLVVPCGMVFAGEDDTLTTTNVVVWLLVLYLAVAFVATWSLMFVGLRSTSSGTAVVATLLEPVTAVLIASLFLGEHLTAAGLLGSLLIVAAIGALGRIESTSSGPEVDPAPASAPR